MWAGGEGGVVGGGSSAGRVHRRCRQCVVTKSSSAQTEMSLRSFAAMPTIVHLVPFAFDGQPLAIERYSSRERCLYESSRDMSDRRR